MLNRLLTTAVQELGEDEITNREPILRYFKSESLALGSYLELDDASVWSTLESLASSSYAIISDLARRLRERRLYKCLDVGMRTRSEVQNNLFLRFRRELRDYYSGHNRLLFDEAPIRLYEWYSFEDPSALNKILVKTRAEDQEPKDIANVSDIVPALRDAERIQRVYAPSQCHIREINQIMEEIDK